MNRTGSCGWYKNGAMSGNVSVQMEWRSAGGATPVFIRMRSQEKLFQRFCRSVLTSRTNVV